MVCQGKKEKATRLVVKCHKTVGKCRTAFATLIGWYDAEKARDVSAREHPKVAPQQETFWDSPTFTPQDYLFSLANRILGGEESWKSGIAPSHQVHDTM